MTTIRSLPDDSAGIKNAATIALRAIGDPQGPFNLSITCATPDHAF